MQNCCCCCCIAQSVGNIKGSAQAQIAHTAHTTTVYCISLSAYKQQTVVALKLLEQFNQGVPRNDTAPQLPETADCEKLRHLHDMPHTVPQRAASI
eukprot:3353-Heterococcus_DN1.PRE.4